jgi:DNA-binding transcriptional ArsR family regulator
VLRALELEDYAHGGYAQPGWLATKLGLPETHVQQALAALRETGQIRERGRRGARRFEPKQVLRVDTRQDPERGRALKLAWTRLATRKLARGHPGSFGFSLFAISKADLRKLRDLQQQYVRAMQSLIASSRATDCVGLYCTQLLDLDDGPENALAE